MITDTLLCFNIIIAMAAWFPNSEKEKKPQMHEGGIHYIACVQRWRLAAECAVGAWLKCPLDSDRVRECSVLPGCLAVEYRRTTSHCTMYGHLGVTDGSRVSMGRVSNDACRYAISDSRNDHINDSASEDHIPSNQFDWSASTDTIDERIAEEKRYTTFPVEGGEIHLKRYNVGRTWDGALEMCRSDGATLVKIDTEKKQDIVRGLFNFKDYENKIKPWIGLRDTTRSNVYRWTDGSALTYTDWDRGEPSFSFGVEDEDCVHIVLYVFGSAWNDNDCSTLLQFVCEM